MAVKRNTKIAAGVMAAAIAVATPLTMKWEGVELRVYKDRLAYGIPTYCYGETENPDFSKTYTIAECGDLLKKRLPQYAVGIAKCLNGEISAKMLGAFTVTAYNIGVGAFCKSGMARQFNAGDKVGACNALMLWTKAGGQIRKGLVNRRTEERKLCLEGIG